MFLPWLVRLLKFQRIVFVFFYLSSRDNTIAHVADLLDDAATSSTGSHGRNLKAIGNALYARTIDEGSSLQYQRTRSREDRASKKSRRSESRKRVGNNNNKRLQQQQQLSTLDLAIPLNITPSYNEATRNLLRSIRAEAQKIHSRRRQGLVNKNLPPCGIIYSLSSLNGSSTNYDLMRTLGFGESLYRVQSVVYEAIVSAARVRTALTLHSAIPSICVEPQSQSNIEVSLFIDRDVVNYFNGQESLLDFLLCSFDHVFYYDEFLQDEAFFFRRLRRYNHRDIFARLSPRSNAMKLLTFLLTPYRFTLYLDGDTAPCPAFQSAVFDTLKTHDILATANPFGYVSTNNQKTFLNAPNHPAFASFEEINGGVFAYAWSEKTFDLFLRALELIPSFAELGFDQDQAMMRQALFEGILLQGLKVSFEPMDRYCRFGWNCERNDCSRCAIIHTRLCTDLGVSITSNSSTSNDNRNSRRCDVRLVEAYTRSRIAMQKYKLFNSGNRKRQAGIAGIIQKLS